MAQKALQGITKGKTLTGRYDSNRTAEAKAQSIHRKSVRKQNNTYGFRIGE